MAEDVDQHRDQQMVIAQASHVVVAGLLSSYEVFSDWPECGYREASIQKAHVDVAKVVRHSILLRYVLDAHRQYVSCNS
jgi:hypothetical protein